MTRIPVLILSAILLSSALLAGSGNLAFANDENETAHGHMKAHVHVSGRIQTVRGNAVTVITRTGTVQTFILTPAQITTVRTGQNIVVFTNGSIVQNIMPAITTVSGVVTDVNGNMLTLQFPDGVLETFLVAPNVADELAEDIGSTVTLSTNTGFATPLSIGDVVIPSFGAPIIGAVSAITGNVVNLIVPSGAVETFTLTPAQVVQVRTRERIVVFTRSHVVTRVVPAVQTVRGVITRVGKTTVTLRLPNGRLQTIRVAPEAAENMRLRRGRPVVVSTTTAFTTPVATRQIRTEQERR